MRTKIVEFNGKYRINDNGSFHEEWDSWFISTHVWETRWLWRARRKLKEIRMRRARKNINNWIEVPEYP